MHLDEGVSVLEELAPSVVGHGGLGALSLAGRHLRNVNDGGRLAGGVALPVLRRGGPDGCLCTCLLSHLG